MTPHNLLTPFLPQIDTLREAISESHYLPREERKGLEHEIDELAAHLKEGELTLTEGEKKLKGLDHKYAANEIKSLMAKIGRLNPTSPRIEHLREIARKLADGETSPQQARQAIHDLMKG